MTVEQYAERKEKGLCTANLSCTQMPSGESAMCPEHHEAAKARKRTSNARPAVKASQKRQWNDWMKRKAEQGTCRQCSKPVVTEWYCEEHRREKRDAWFTKYGKDTPRSTKKCSNCGGSGHRADTCEQRPADMPKIEVFATARYADDEDTESKSGRYWNRGEGSKSYCQPHTHGVSLGAPPFFYAYCTTCQEKKAAGKVTGEEGPLKENWAKKARKAKPKVDWERLRRNQEARRKFMLSQVPRE